MSVRTSSRAGRSGRTFTPEGGGRPGPEGAPGSHEGLGARSAPLFVPLAAVAGLVAFALLPDVRRDADLGRAVLGAAGLLLAWAGVVFGRAVVGSRALSLEVVIRRPHWVQACAQSALFLYWGWHVPGVSAFAPFILAQLLFAYGFDSLLSLTRRGRYALGFGPFPIVFSINLFLLFKPAWFHWQFVIVALGYLAKELIRWQKEGRSAHIFNPSSFPLAVFSLALIVTGATDTTWGVEIASTLFNPPNIYLVIFLVALPGQLLFGVTTMTMSAVVTTYLFGLLYYAATGTYFFFDSYIPIAVFLGMHLLFTDPSTSPRTESGRVVFGVLYGLGTTAMYALLHAGGVPTFYDKLLPVPILNVLVQLLDRLTARGPLRLLNPPEAGVAAPARWRVATVGAWAAIFAVISLAQGIGDRHRGQWLPFWQESCGSGSVRACDYLAGLEETYCGQGSGWACNELGIRLAGLDRGAALATLRRGCELEFPSACENEGRLAAGVPGLVRTPPLLPDLPVVLRGSKGPVGERNPEALYAMACQQGWPEMCGATPAGQD